MGGLSGGVGTDVSEGRRCDCFDPEEIGFAPDHNEATMIIRPASEADLAAIMALEDAAFPPSQQWSKNSWRSELDGERCCLVGLNPQIIAVATFSIVADVADLNRIIVEEDERGRGHANRLIRAGLEWAVASGATRTLLEVRADNQAAIRLYRRNGFSQIARRVDYYAPGADALVMEATHV